MAVLRLTRFRIDPTDTEEMLAKRSQRTTVAAYTALGWVVLFFAFHIYWYLGGPFASPGKLPGAPHTLAAWLFAILVNAAWPLGVFVCLAIAWGWARGLLALPTEVLAWVGGVVLLLRGGAGIIDDLTRATGLLPNGLTGLSANVATGAADLHWSDWAIEAYFLAGGIAFALLAVRFSAHRAHLGSNASCLP